MKFTFNTVSIRVHYMSFTVWLSYDIYHHHSERYGALHELHNVVVVWSLSSTLCVTVSVRVHNIMSFTVSPLCDIYHHHSERYGALYELHGVVVVWSLPSTQWELGCITWASQCGCCMTFTITTVNVTLHYRGNAVSQSARNPTFSSAACSGWQKRKHQRSALLALFIKGIHRRIPLTGINDADHYNDVIISAMAS